MARTRQVNVDGMIHTIRTVSPGMKECGYGRVINIASNAATGTALPGTTFYAAIKAEVLILTRRFAMEFGRNGITVNAVHDEQSHHLREKIGYRCQRLSNGGSRIALLPETPAPWYI